MQFLQSAMCVVVICSQLTRGGSAGLERALRRSSGKLYKRAVELAASDDNVIISPFSITQALGMVLAGADGDTKARILSWMSATPQDAGAVHRLMRRNILRATMNGDAIRAANALYIKHDFPVDAAFLSSLATNYLAEASQTTFSERARVNINRWVARKTQQKISSLLPPGAFTHSTRLVIISALYFNAAWQTPFVNIENTMFTTGAGSRLSVPFMQRTGATRVKYFPRLQMLLLAVPYARTATSESSHFVVGLPFNHAGAHGSLDSFHLNVPTLFENLDLATWEETEISLSLPKFQLSLQSDLKQLLGAEGLSELFESGRCDLTGISDHEQLYISQFRHKAFMRVDRNGTEAGAASQLQNMARDSSHTIVADRPFFFAVYSESLKSFLFTGNLQNPTASSR